MAQLEAVYGVVCTCSEGLAGGAYGVYSPTASERAYELLDEELPAAARAVAARAEAAARAVAARAEAAARAAAARAAAEARAAVAWFEAVWAEETVAEATAAH